MTDAGDHAGLRARPGFRTWLLTQRISRSRNLSRAAKIRGFVFSTSEMFVGDVLGA